MEEDIKILEEKVIYLEKHIKNYEKSDCKTEIYQELVKGKQAMQNLLTSYKQLAEENKEIKKIVKRDIRECKSEIIAT